MSARYEIAKTAIRLSGMKKMLDLPEKELLAAAEKKNAKRPFRMPKDGKHHYIDHLIALDGIDERFHLLEIRPRKRRHDRAILYLYGGGMVTAADDLDLRLAIPVGERSGRDVWFACYPLCTRYSIFDLTEMVWRSYKLMLETYRPEDIAFYGYSSGAATAIETLLYNTEKRKAGEEYLPMPNKVIAISAGSVPASEEEKTAMLQKDATDFMCPVEFMTGVSGFLRHGKAVPDYLLSPRLGDFTDFPEVWHYYAGSEILSAAEPYFRAAYEKYGVQAHFHTEPGMFHCYPIVDFIPECRPAYDEIIRILKEEPMKADYKNWVPQGMVTGFAAGAAALAVGAVAFGATKHKSLAAISALGAAGCGAWAGWCAYARDKFSYDGERKLSKQIVVGTAEFVTLPEGGVGLDVGCGSGALTIACAKRNPHARMIGIDRWGPEYSSFSKTVCEQNAAAEGVENAEFMQGDAISLPFADGTFDAVTSNYVYHNITGKNKQALLLETLRVLKKGGAFAIHDIMSYARYGDMQKFCAGLRATGYEKVELIDTANGLFMSRSEAGRLFLTGSAVLVGVK